MSRGSERPGLSEDEHYRERAQRKKELIDRRIARAIGRGVVVVNTGNGKGRRSSGFGMLARSATACRASSCSSSTAASRRPRRRCSAASTTSWTTT